MASERQRNGWIEPTERERWNMLTDRFQLQFGEPLPIGPATAELFQNIYDAVSAPDGNPVVKEAVDKLWDLPRGVDMPPDKKADYITELLPRAFTALLLPENPNFIHDIKWPNVFAQLENPDTLIHFAFNTMFPIQSNVADRGKTIIAELHAYGLLNDVVLLELGCSGNYIGKKAVMELPYAPTRVMERKKKGASVHIVENPYLSQVFNELVDMPVDFNKIVGVDLFKPDDVHVTNWRDACSLYLDERLFEQKVTENHILDEARPENVTWQFGDITTYSPDDYQEDHPGEPLPDVTIAFFVEYLLPKRDQKKGLKNLAAFALKNKGIAIVMDDIQSIDRDHQPTIIPRNRNFNSTGIWVFDGKKPDAGWLKHMSLKTGRADAIIYEPALANVMIENELTKARARRRRSSRTAP